MTPSSIASLCVLPGLLLSLSCASAAAPTKASADAVQSIRSAIAARNCGEAVERLKAGLENGYPEVMLVAGSMYENAVCVRRDWNNAVTFYAQAFNAGLPQGADRMAAGYADPQNGADFAAALWWGRRGSNAGFEGCEVSAEAAKDPDRFVAELTTWSRGRRAQCNYMVGIITTISAELKYPEPALARAAGGEVTLRFLFDVPRIELQKGDSKEYALLGWVDGNTLHGRSDKKATDGFEQALGEVANRALARYPQPKGIPAGTLILVKYVFEVDTSRETNQWW